MTKQKSESKQKPGESRTFEKSLVELETIVGEMEGGKLGLEEMIDRFEKGQSLVEYCTQKLNEVERKIETLVKKGDQLATEPFAPEETEEAEEAAEGKEGEPKDSLF